MQPSAVTVAPDAPISKARDLMEEHGFGLLLVVKAEGELVGFVTRAGLKEIADWDAPVERHTHPARFAVSPEDTLGKAALILLGNRLVLLPVVEDEKLVGVITQGELLKGLTRGLGIGLEATRLTVNVRSESEDLYDVLALLRSHGARILSLVQGETRNGTCDVVLRIQGVAEKDKLRDELEAALKSQR
jgi:CBS domain-containing protein